MEKMFPVTLIGSLPHTDPDEAVRLVFENNIIPCLPELPMLGENMLQYIKNPGNLACAAAFQKRYASVKKIQSVGTCTLVYAAKMPAKEANQRIYAHIMALLKDLRADRIILFLDEPIIGLDCQKLWEPLFSMLDKDPGLKNITLGVHTCNNMNWNPLFCAEQFKIISFDASSYARGLVRSAKYRSNKTIAWGVERIEDVKKFQLGDLLTPPCGLGPSKYKVSDCQKVIQNLQEIASDLLAK